MRLVVRPVWWIALQNKMLICLFYDRPASKRYALPVFGDPLTFMLWRMLASYFVYLKSCYFHMKNKTYVLLPVWPPLLARPPSRWRRVFVLYWLLL